MTVLIKKTDHPLWSEGYNRAIEDMRTADPVTIPRAHYEALMAAANKMTTIAKVSAPGHRTLDDFCRDMDAICDFARARLAALRAAGIEDSKP